MSYWSTLKSIVYSVLNLLETCAALLNVLLLWWSFTFKHVLVASLIQALKLLAYLLPNSTIKGLNDKKTFRPSKPEVAKPTDRMCNWWVGNRQQLLYPCYNTNINSPQWLRELTAVSKFSGPSTLNIRL